VPLELLDEVVLDIEPLVLAVVLPPLPVVPTPLPAGEPLLEVGVELIPPLPPVPGRWVTSSMPRTSEHPADAIITTQTRSASPCEVRITALR
jgi:hypothetical protein